MQITEINFEKTNGLVPAVVQDAYTQKVMMLGYMNKAALEKTLKTGLVTFFSRSKGRLWTKGESSGNYLKLVDIRLDCDKDTLLVSVNPAGPVCHTGSSTCWGEMNEPNYGFISTLESIIKSRKDKPNEKSYTSSLFRKGINKIAQKVGEEAVELIIESKDNDKNLFLNEAADLIYHILILLEAKSVSFNEVAEVLKSRNLSKNDV